MARDFHQIEWDGRLRDEAVRLFRLAVREDLGRTGDATSKALIPPSATGAAVVAARSAGIVAGLPAAELVLRLVDPKVRWIAEVGEGDPVRRREPVARLEGPARGILAAERVLLNVLGRLSGIATLTRRFVEAVEGTKARIYDTRKTTPGWRRLEKYAVRVGGGRNHRTGLFDAILIKDNHLALGRQGIAGRGRFSPVEAVAQARQFIQRRVPRGQRRAMLVEIEVDTLEQLELVLPAGPDIVLLDNMPPHKLREAVARRNARNPAVELEASGGITLANVRAVADSGVDRISVGALTHAAASLDFGLDWQ